METLFTCAYLIFFRVHSITGNWLSYVNSKFLDSICLPCESKTIQQLICIYPKFLRHSQDPRDRANCPETREAHHQKLGLTCDKSESPKRADFPFVEYACNPGDWVRCRRTRSARSREVPYEVSYSLLFQKWHHASRESVGYAHESRYWINCRRAKQAA
jgi:hypothetical protein